MSPHSPRTTQVRTPRPPVTFLCILTLVLAGCGDSSTAPEPDPPVTVSLQLLATPGAEHLPGATVELRVRVLGNGVPAEGQVVRFRSEGGDGAFVTTNVTTDSTGVAHGLWHPGTVAGDRVVEIRLPAHPELPPETLTSRVIPGPATQLVLEAETLRMKARRELRPPPLHFLDDWGNPVPPPQGVVLTPGDPGVVEVTPDGRIRAVGEGDTRLQVSAPFASSSFQVEVAWEGVITLTFDDGYRGVHERAWPVLAAHGLRANVGVVTRSADESWTDFLSEAQLQELHDAGWAMASHTVTHANLTELSGDALEAELSESRAWLEERGFRGAGAFIVPYHSWNAEIQAMVAEHYTLARGRSAWLGFPGTLAEWIPEHPMDLSALDVDYYRFDTPELREDLRQMLSTAVAEGLYLEVFFHDVPPDRLETFEAIVAVVAEFSDQVVTFAELLEQAGDG